jgi:hypothetical protein
MPTIGWGRQRAYYQMGQTGIQLKELHKACTKLARLLTHLHMPKVAANRTAEITPATKQLILSSRSQ